MAPRPSELVKAFHPSPLANAQHAWRLMSDFEKGRRGRGRDEVLEEVALLLGIDGTVEVLSASPSGGEWSSDEWRLGRWIDVEDWNDASIAYLDDGPWSGTKAGFYVVSHDEVEEEFRNWYEERLSDEERGPQEDDLVTPDYVHFFLFRSGGTYRGGGGWRGAVLTIPTEREIVPEGRGWYGMWWFIEKYRERSGYYGNVWYDPGRYAGLQLVKRPDDYEFWARAQKWRQSYRARQMREGGRAGRAARKMEPPPREYDLYTDHLFSHQPWGVVFYLVGIPDMPALHVTRREIVAGVAWPRILDFMAEETARRGQPLRLWSARPGEGEESWDLIIAEERPSLAGLAAHRRRRKSA